RPDDGVDERGGRGAADDRLVRAFQDDSGTHAKTSLCVAGLRGRDARRACRAERRALELEAIRTAEDVGRGGTGEKAAREAAGRLERHPAKRRVAEADFLEKRR